MIYSIGNIVKLTNDIGNTYIVVATKEFPLTFDYLKSKEVNFNIDRFEDFAKIGISVDNGFDYKISKLLSFHDKIAKIESVVINVFEGDIKR